MKPSDVHNHLREPGSLRVAPNATAVGGGESLQCLPAWDAGDSLLQPPCFAFTQGGRCSRKPQAELLESRGSRLKDRAHFSTFVVVVVVLCLSKGFHYVAQAASRLHLGFQSHSVLRVLTAALSIRMFQSKKTSAFGEICLYVNVDIQNKSVY